jgi:hypothetical protein
MSLLEKNFYYKYKLYKKKYMHLKGASNISRTDFTLVFCHGKKQTLINIRENATQYHGTIDPSQIQVHELLEPLLNHNRTTNKITIDNDPYVEPDIILSMTNKDIGERISRFITENYNIPPNTININKIVFQNCPCVLLPDISYVLQSINLAKLHIDPNCYLYLTNILTCLLDEHEYLMSYDEHSRHDQNYQRFIKKEKTRKNTLRHILKSIEGDKDSDKDIDRDIDRDIVEFLDISDTTKSFLTSIIHDSTFLNISPISIMESYTPNLIVKDNDIDGSVLRPNYFGLLCLLKDYNSNCSSIYKKYISWEKWRLRNDVSSWRDSR